MTHLRFKNVERVLALDLHPRSLGYAVFEDADLLHCGLRKWHSGERKIASRKICRLLDLWMPSQIVVREGGPRTAYAIVRQLARKTETPTRIVRRDIVQTAFRPARRLSRFDIARLVAERYPELALRVPAGRELGHAEPFQMRMFNAVAVGISFGALSNQH